MALLTDLPPEMLGAVVHVLLSGVVERVEDDARAVCRLEASCQSLRRLVRIDDDQLFKELDAARQMIVEKRLHELRVAAGLKQEDAAAMASLPSDYRAFVLKPPTPTTNIDLDDHLWKVDAGAGRARVVVRVLNVSSCVDTLQLLDDPDVDAAGLADGVANSCSLKVLALGNCSIGNGGIAALASAVARSRSLRDLQLPGCDIGHAFGGASVLAGAVISSGAIVSLSLHDNGLGDAGAAVVATALALCAALRFLRLRGNQIGVVGATALAFGVETSTALHHLGLGDNSLGDKGVMALAAGVAKASTLRKLVLDNNGVGDVGVAAIARAISAGAVLHTLVLGAPYRGHLTVAGVGKDNTVGDEGALALAAAVSSCRTFSSLVITNYKPSTIGEEALRVAAEARPAFDLETHSEILEFAYDM